MATDRSNDVRAFRDFLEKKLSHGAGDLTLDEALGLWELETQPAAIPVPPRQAGARRKYEQRSRPRVPASSGVPAEALGEVRPSCCALRGSRWLD
jgi:hypothetical protein